MSAPAWLILENQLFQPSHFSKQTADLVFMAEDVTLFRRFRFHKNRIILILAAMRQIAADLTDHGYRVHYEALDTGDLSSGYEEKLASFLEKWDVTALHCYEIEDKFMETRLNRFCRQVGLRLVVHPTPLFMVSREQFREYLANSRKPFMKTFYQSRRLGFGILMDERGKPVGGKWSFDQSNRKKLPKGLEIPDLPPKTLSRVERSVIELVKQTFPDHPGSGNDFWLPTTREESLEWLDHFLYKKLCLFGDYQDALTERHPFLFHSVLSPMINLGLLLPDEVVDAARNTAENVKVPLNSLEGFIRQIIGWREFVRGIYQNFSEVQEKRNFWGHTRKLTPHFYEGTTGIPVLDEAVKKTLRYGYAHHIERLMVLSNLMLLCRVHPHEVYRWFMEMFVDAYDWVMGPNVYGMGQFSDGGIFATKPYICGSNYLLKMSDFARGDWCHIVDGLYWRFIDKHRDFYQSNHRMSMMVRLLDRMEAGKKVRLFNLAENFIEKVASPGSVG
ncbi:MAG: cryptochrome/photolyase family protein [Acidobacteriota bacterium]|nr:cryptochrome/photolyase family protein [Acidobacteriota bacterium]